MPPLKLISAPYKAQDISGIMKYFTLSIFAVQSRNNPRSTCVGGVPLSWPDHTDACSYHFTSMLGVLACASLAHKIRPLQRIRVLRGAPFVLEREQGLSGVKAVISQAPRSQTSRPLRAPSPSIVHLCYRLSHNDTPKREKRLSKLPWRLKVAIIQKFFARLLYSALAVHLALNLAPTLAYTSC
ncbi:hypothetical protein FA13DRAFT_314203 [Coprinellus micaceus]|uniref:Uncharacterized protein n=1 Tax=Coprinellus micaceus TaxID=71717 RepID=A0A4Y7TD91_COPMI|nr:hypothetical protein FA13DRAFT_314203 [Coprinellus micaceus]